MARVTVTGNVITLISDIKLDDLKKVEKYRPQNLVIKDDDGNEVFKFATGGYAGEIQQDFCVVFSDVPTSGGYAQLSLLAMTENPANEVVDDYGKAVSRINDLEKTLPKVIEEIDKYIEQVKGCITVQ